MKQKIWNSLVGLALIASGAIAQSPDKPGAGNVSTIPDIPTTNKAGSKYQFTIVKDNGATDVKNQFHSGTCWCYSTQSFLESELMRMGKGTYNLSQMFVIHQMYMLKAEHYMRYQGHTNFGDGGEPHDVINALRMYGVVPASAYSGMPATMEKPELAELDNVLHAMLDAMLKLPEGHLDPNWMAAYQGALDGYMGKVPTEFTYQGKTYTPQSFAKSLGLNADDYVEITSFTHHPFYSKFILEVPDNFENGEAYNVPIEDLQKITDNALTNGYTIEWGSDVSESGFSARNYSLAIEPEAEMGNMTSAQKDSVFLNPVPQKKITQEMRQEAFDNLATTDDHGMQITGLAKDQLGQEYYIVKNSWGTSNYCKGYFYVSQAFYLYKTTSIMVNKNAIPADIRKKMGI